MSLLSASRGRDAVWCHTTQPSVGSDTGEVKGFISNYLHTVIVGFCSEMGDFHAFADFCGVCVGVWVCGWVWKSSLDSPSKD